MQKDGCAKQVSLFCRSFSDEEKKSLIILTPEVERKVFSFVLNQQTDKQTKLLAI
jgi:hypothetical protein